MADPDFFAMRAGLVARGLLTADFRLTEAGVAHCDQLVAELKEAEAPEPLAPDAPRVRWTYPAPAMRRAA